MTRKKLKLPVSLLSLAIIALAAPLAFGDHPPPGITTFTYTQTDSVTGSGTIAAPANSLFNGVDITWTDTAMPAAFVRDPAGGGSPGGAVGAFDMEAGNTADNGEDVALYWNATADIAGAKDPLTVIVQGTGDDGNPYELPISLVFMGDNVLPDEHFPLWGINDYRWSLDYVGSDALDNPRTAIWLSPSWADVPVLDGGGGRQQRYTQNSNAIGAGLTNTDTSSGSEKDAFDQNGNITQFAAIGQPLEISFGWRDNNSIATSVAVDNFNFQGLLEYDEANIPEPSTFLLSTLGLLGFAMMRRRRR